MTSNRTGWTPTRVRRRRSVGWRAPRNTVYVGRGSAWGNKYKMGDPFPKAERDADPSLNDLTMNLDDVLALYRPWVERRLAENPAFLAPLRGRNLMCWCPFDEPCHADILLEMANAPRAAALRR